MEHACPAKVNLSLAITGKRMDGFHELHSVVAQTTFGDTLRLEWQQAGTAEADSVIVDGVNLPQGDNTVAHALRLFREASEFRMGAFTARLQKRIPVGAGLGGGSSDAVATLKALQDMFGEQAYGIDWETLATMIGSDCRLFMEEGPVIMEGRGDKVSPLPPGLASRIRGRPLVLFKPDFSISTMEAYRRLAKGRHYSEPARVKALMQDWSAGNHALPDRCNDFERLLDEWIPSLALVLDRLRRLHGLDARLSGSGSACFVFPSDGASVIPVVKKELESAWGQFFWLQQTELH